MRIDKFMADPKQVLTFLYICRVAMKELDLEDEATKIEIGDMVNDLSDVTEGKPRLVVFIALAYFVATHVIHYEGTLSAVGRVELEEKIRQLCCDVLETT